MGEFCRTICVNLCPADTTDNETPFKYGHPGPGSWNDSRGALTFLTGYLRQRVGTSGDPVIIWQHYSYCEGFNFDWNWWSAKQRRVFYDAIKGYNIVALLHGHTHAPARYRWPDPANTPRKSGACSAISHRQTCEPLTCSPAVPSEPGLQTGGGTFYVFHILNDQLIAAHHDTHGWAKDPQLFLIKSMLFQPLTR